MKTIYEMILNELKIPFEYKTYIKQKMMFDLAIQKQSHPYPKKIVVD